MMKFYNHVTIPAHGGNKLTYKRGTFPAETVTTLDGDNFSFDVSGRFPRGEYVYQIKRDTEIIETGRFELLNDLDELPPDCDPRSTAELTLEAIDAMLANRATAQQRRIQIGDKSIEYSTMSELLQWREYFLRMVAREQGKSEPRRELAVFK